VPKKTEKKLKGIYEKIPGSGIFSIRYADETGLIRREVAGKKGAAIQLYQKRKTEILQGKKLPENLRAVVRVSDLADAVERDYRINGKKSLDSVQRRLKKHLLPFFGMYSASDVATVHINKYVDQRRLAGAENATINRELALLKRMYHLASNRNPPLVHRVPSMARLHENSPRTGFVEEVQFNRLAKQADEHWLGTMVLLAYTYGFRKGELLALRVRQIDLVSKKIRLEAASTKNNQGRTVTMTSEVVSALSSCVRGRKVSDFVFVRQDNQPVLDFRGAWYKLCERADLGRFARKDGKTTWCGLTFHDLRRSAVRNMIRRGISERVAMMISGHKTRSVFDRYNIVSDSDIDEAAVKIASGRCLDLETSTDTKTSTAPNGGCASNVSDVDQVLFLQ
jgi:integrase